MADEDDSQEKDDVGPGRPPKDGRFPPGTSGNWNGRPKGSGSAAALLKKAALKKVPVTEGGRRKLVTKEQLAFHQLMSKAAGGSLKAIEIYFRMIAKADNGQEANRPEVLVPDLDLATKRKIAERVLRDVEEREAEEAADERAARERARVGG